MMLTEANRQVDIPVEGKGREVHRNACTAFGVATEEKRGTVIVNRMNTVEQGHCVRLQNFRNFARKERDDGLVASSGELRRLHPQSVSVDGVMGGS